MSAIAAVCPQPDRGRSRWGPAAMAAISILAATGFVLLRLGTAAPFTSTGGACDRLREAGLAITAADTFCQPLPWTATASYVSASLLLAIGFVLPCVVLAATGRRLSALAPLVVAPALALHGVVVADTWWSGTWREGSLEGGAAMALLFVAPVLAAIAAHHRTARPSRRPIPLLACTATWILVLFPIIGVVYVARAMFVRHFAALGGTFDDLAMLVPAAISTAVFGSLLGPDRRWWPWILAPVAVLLSVGPSMALLVAPQGFTDWSRFGSVVPLFSVGLIASTWRPLAERLVTWMRREARSVGERELVRATAAGSRRVRPIVVGNAIGAALLLVSMVAFRADPLPAQIGTALPTYLGTRTSVMDLRTRQLLHRALDDMHRYRADQGSYRGFDAAQAAEIDPDLTWQSGLPRASDGGRIPELTMGIVTASATTARVAAVSKSGNAFCIQHDADGIAYGLGSDRNDVTSVQALDRALATCGSTVWSARAVRPFPITTLCDGMEADAGYEICRMVQVVLIESMEETGPA